MSRHCVPPKKRKHLGGCPLGLVGGLLLPTVRDGWTILSVIRIKSFANLESLFARKACHSAAQRVPYAATVGLTRLRRSRWRNRVISSAVIGLLR